jgi:membrane-bound lytic murein transglycosylase B
MLVVAVLSRLVGSRLSCRIGPGEVFLMSGRRCGRLAAMAALAAVIWTASFAAAQPARTAGSPVAPVPRTVSFEPLIQRLVAEGRPGAEVRALFSRPEMVFDPGPMAAKLTELYMSRYGLRLVTDIQNRLSELGYHPWPATGKLSRLTKWAIRAWQRQNGFLKRPWPRRSFWPPARRQGKAPPAWNSLRKKPLPFTRARSPRSAGEARFFFTATGDSWPACGSATACPRRWPWAWRGGNPVRPLSWREPAVVILSGMALARDYALVADAFVYERPSPDRPPAGREGPRARRLGFRSWPPFWSMPGASAATPWPSRVHLRAIGISQFMPTSALTLARDGTATAWPTCSWWPTPWRAWHYLNKAGVGGQTPRRRCARPFSATIKAGPT